VLAALGLIHFSFRLHLRVPRHFSDGVFHGSLSFVGGALDVFLVHVPFSILCSRTENVGNRNAMPGQPTAAAWRGVVPAALPSLALDLKATLERLRSTG
jgi:hypothetical protein